MVDGSGMHVTCFLLDFIPIYLLGYETLL